MTEVLALVMAAVERKVASHAETLAVAFLAYDLNALTGHAMGFSRLAWLCDASHCSCTCSQTQLSLGHMNAYRLAAGCL